MNIELFSKTENELKAVAWERARNTHNNSNNPYERNWSHLKKMQRKHLMEIELNILLKMREMEGGYEED